MWAFHSTLVSAAILINQFAAAQETATTSYPPQVAQHLDISVNPCDDFYKFSCGGYSHSVQMTSEYVDAPYSIDHIEEKNRQVLMTIIKSDTPVVSKYFDSCMDTTRINELGHKPLQQALEKIDAGKSIGDLFRVAGELSLENFNFLVGFFVSSDERQATRNVLQITRSSLPIRSRLHHGFADIQPEYRKYISTLLTQAQVADSATVEELVDTVVHLETRIADIDMIDFIDSYMTFDEASTTYPLTVKEFVTGMFERAGVPVPDRSQPIVIYTPSYLEELEKLLSSTELSALKTLMKYQYIHDKKDLLGDQITTASFELNGNKINGVSERPTREKFCVDFVLQQLPNRMGKEYAALMFDAESANVAKDMFSRIEATMKRHLVQTDWLDDSTRKKALEKLAKVMKLIGYSEDVEQVNDVTLSAGDFFGDTELIQRSLSLQQIKKISKPVNRGEWEVAAMEAKSYYNLNHNKVVFPAGILQPPYFNKSYPAAINYGATGTSMALKLFHAFDWSGSWYDGDGNSKFWWTDETEEEYENRSQCFVNQNMKTYEFSDWLDLYKKISHIEIFADASGVALAFEAYQKFMEEAKPQPTKHHEPLPKMDRNLQDSFSKTDLEKLFYVAYAQSWCSSHHNARVNDVIMNDKYFGNVFKCSVGAKMNPKDKCTL